MVDDARLAGKPVGAANTDMVNAVNLRYIGGLNVITVTEISSPLIYVISGSIILLVQNTA